MPCDVQSPNEPWIEFPCLISVSTVASFSTPNSPLSSSTGSSLCPVAAGTPANRTPQVEMSCATPRRWTQGRYVAPGPPLSHHSCLVWLWKVRHQRLQPVSKSGEENTGEGEGCHDKVTYRTDMMEGWGCCSGWQSDCLAFTEPWVGPPAEHHWVYVWIPRPGRWEQEEQVRISRSSVDTQEMEANLGYMTSCLRQRKQTPF